MKCLALMSGGLDSFLAVKIIQAQGIEVLGLHVATPFGARVGGGAAALAAAHGIPLREMSLGDELLRVVEHPRHGRGGNMNPCIDCHALMFRRAAILFPETGASFLITGEVLGQRPMSQHRGALRLIEKETGLSGRLLRPLSAKHLPETDAERRGEVDRNALGEISGRSRRSQMELVEQFGIQEFSQPGGGCCFLADENYARRFRDLLAHRPKESLTQDDLVLLKVGRHFRLSPAVKVIVGREEAENVYLDRFAPGRWSLEVQEGGSPIALIEGDPDELELNMAARITARYSDQKDRTLVRVRALRDGIERWCDVLPAADADLEPLRL